MRFVDPEQSPVVNGIMNVLQDKLSSGDMPDDCKGGMISSFLTVVEVIGESGASRILVFFNDNRMTTLFGLLQMGQMQIQSGFIASNSSE